MSKTFAASTTLIGTMFGAGYLGIPYVVMKSGFLIGLFYLLFVFSLLTLVMLYLGEISLRTKTKHQLTGYAQKYLGKKGKIIMLISLVFGIYSAFVAYLIAEGDSFSYMIFNNTSYSLYLGIVFWAFLSFLSWKGLKALEEGESTGVTIAIILAILIVVFTWNKIDVNNLTYVNWGNFFVPFGVIIFSFLGFSAVPTVHDILGEERKLLKKVIWIAHIIPLIIYIFFTLAVLGFKGMGTPEIATLALGKPFVLLGMITMFTSYFSLSIALINNFRLDFGFSKFKSWLITISVPLVIFIILKIANIAGFVKILSFGGIISGGLSVVLILLMISRAKIKGNRNPEYSIPYSKILIWFLILVFVLAVIMEVAGLV
ncbi:MAG: aromatic amino acid transport family protein [archaeon]|nr:aromatic amino acid transport family protein [archaeon]